MNEIKDIKLAQTIAAKAAQKSKENQAICLGGGKGEKSYIIVPSKEATENVVKIVRYTKPNKNKPVLSVNGNRDTGAKPKPVEKKPKVKSTAKTVK